MIVPPNGEASVEEREREREREREKGMSIT